MATLNSRGGWDITDEEAAEVLRLSGLRPAGADHACDEFCRCPVHRTPMIYAPSADEHACQDIDCEYGHGTYRALANQEARRAGRLRKALLALEAEVVAGLTTPAHEMVMRAGLPFCRCGHSLHGGDSTGAFITHALAILATAR